MRNLPTSRGLDDFAKEGIARAVINVTVHNNLEWVCDLLTRVALSMLTDGPGLFDKPARVVGEHTTALKVCKARCRERV